MTGDLKGEALPIPAVGERFRHFQIVGEAGAGGMGVVLEAEDTRLGRRVALKFLTRVAPVELQTAERLRREARSLAAIDHPNIVAIYELEELEGSPYLVMEWVPGISLDRFRRARPCDQEEFLRLASDIAAALAAAHSRGLVHRDLKPANVLVTADGGAKLVDFGLAKLLRGPGFPQLTDAEGIVGTPAYMSPEQATGAEVGPPSDVFSFGVLAYELLAGRLPFDGDSAPARLYSIVHEPPVSLAILRPDLPTSLITLVERCLHKVPEERFPTGTELARALQQATTAWTGARTRDFPTARSHIDRESDLPEIRYCETADGASIAYAVSGSGPVLVRVLGWFTHLEMEWSWPSLRLIWDRLGERHTVVRYDGRGIGLSSPWTADFSEQTRQLDLEAVLDAVDAERVVLFGISEGGFSAALYAASRPERVSRLIVYGSYSRGASFRPGDDPEENRALETLMRSGWGRDTPEIRQIFTTRYFGTDADPKLLAFFNEMQRASADGDTAARYQASLHQRSDAREELARIEAPTLVIHCREDRIVPFEEGRLFASRIPGAKLLPLPTMTHYFPVDDDMTHRMVDAIERFTI